MRSAVRLLPLSLVLAIGLTLVEASSSPALASAAQAATAPGYITLLVGRGMYGKMTGGKLDPQVLTIDQVAPTLQSMGLWAAGNVIVSFVLPD